MSFTDTLQILTLFVTIFGFPLAIFVFVYEQRQGRLNEEEEIYQALSDGYTNFLQLVIENPDLKLLTRPGELDLTEEQKERVFGILCILIALFERAFIVLHEETMPPRRRRRWSSWEDFMREWCRRPEFRAALPNLLPGEDPEFAAYIARLAEEEGRADA